MHFTVLCLILLTFARVEPKAINQNNALKVEPRIFFRQIVEASGLFPIEINVPDTISSMMNGINSMWSYISGNASEDVEEPSVENMPVYDAVDLQSQPNSKNGKHRKRKVKNVKKETSAISETENTLIDFILLF